MFKREFTLGGSATGADPDTFALILRNVFGAKVKLVTGYPGGNDINLAMERSEVDGRCGWSWSSLKSLKAWLPQINLLAQFAIEKNAELPNVPWTHRARGERRAAAGAAAPDRGPVPRPAVLLHARTFPPTARLRCATPSTPP